MSRSRWSSAETLRDALNRVLAVHPGAEIIANDVGNLMFAGPNNDPELGWIDLVTGGINYWERQ